MKISIFIAAIFTILLAAATFSIAADFKNEVALFKYDGVREGKLSSEKFGVFRGILETKIINLKREALQGDISGLDYLKNIYINFHDEDTFTKQEGIKHWLRNQSTVLCLLRGTLVADDNVTYSAKSKFYLGELKGSFPWDVVIITLPVNSSEFANTQDSHSLVILYALMMDLKRQGQDNSYLIRILNSAKGKLANIKSRGGLRGDLLEIEKALQKAEMELLGSGDEN